MNSLDIATPASEAHGWLLGRINFERQTSLPYGEHVFRLDRMRSLLERLGRPDLDLSIVHITGTKGKGSTAAMIAAALTASGRRTGLFSSPHLELLGERMAVDGVACTDDELAELVDVLRPVVEDMDLEVIRKGLPDIGPTYFELTTALALLRFAQHGVDAAVLEVGMGGRLDSTNVCQPLVSVITSISYDHTRQLGNTLAAIAREKAGIIKPGVPVVSGVTGGEAQAVIAQMAAEQGSRLIQLDREFAFEYTPPRDLDRRDDQGRVTLRYPGANQCDGLSDVRLGLHGQHQGANAAVALATLDQLVGQGWDIPEQAVRSGLAELVWPARIEVVRRRPTVVIDTAHNVASAEALVSTLAESFQARRRTLVFAASRDKDVAGMLRVLLPRFDRVIFTRYTQNPRALEVAELVEMARAEGTVGSAEWSQAENAAEAWQQAASGAAADDLICVTGSFFIAAEMRENMGS